ncbi:sel1 repeat family protein [Sulfuriroseicoccus oceanibius]|uniref:Sel1 repeat family protein n=1 Tax=Sulfuriroseicoccus oceanibius TaxID=2707525 RepID=A0A6B3L9L9_9BACT|nr:sel1 repeat family protein [Sulfuriroseicoccus oceanibius]QQL44009.1 sel1 repeat family protein [Sulfuriroseicoccus oceanibius]
MKWFLYGVIALLCSHAMAHDGAWNGKRWERERLFAGVAEGDPDALAEWAYCSSKVLLGIAYDEQLIYSRAKEAAERGSLFGRSLVGMCYQNGIAVEIDYEFSARVLNETMDQGCGYAAGWVGFLFSKGRGVMRDFDQVYEIAMTRVPEYARLRETLLASVQDDSTSSFFSPACTTDRWMESFGRTGDVNDALCSLYADAYSTRYYPGGIKLGVKDRMGVRMWDAAMLGHIVSVNQVAWTRINAGGHRYGSLLALNAGTAGQKEALRNLAVVSSRPYSRLDDRSREVLFITSEESGDDLWERACRAGFVDSYYTGNIAQKLYDLHIPKSPRRDYATQLMKRMINRGDPEGHRNLGYCLMYVHGWHRYHPVELNKKRGIAHLIYGSAESHDCECTLAWCYFKGGINDRFLDRVRGVALARATINRRGHGGCETKLRQWIKDEGAKLSAEEKKQVEDLLKRGFPRSDEFRRPAFELLKEVGDLPPNAKFVSAKPLREDEKWD